jgi:hypothetical protein
MKTKVIEKPKARRVRPSKGSPMLEEVARLETDDPIRKAVLTRAARAIASAVQGATIASLQHALEAPTDAGSAAQLLSIAVGNDEALRSLDPLTPAIMRGAAMKHDLLERAGGAHSTSEVAEFLGISRQAVAKRVQRGTLLALPNASGDFRFPAVQFTDTGTVKGLEEVLAAFVVESPWTRLAVLLDTDKSLGGKRVIDALRAGQLDEVLNVVRSFGA